jgi:regulator of sirC expression with transglutaminase-like and TPR domain
MYSGSSTQAMTDSHPPSPSSARKAFAEEVSKSDPDIHLAKAALLIASESYPQLPVSSYLSRIDALAERVQDRLGPETAPLLVLQEILGTLYGETGLRGNRVAYYDPRNSFLNDVLDRRVGIPLTLGMVVLEVAWRLDLPLVGVNFPGHFLLRYQGEAISLLIDPFDSGHTFFEDEAQSLLDRAYGGMVRIRPEFMRTARKRDMLVRLLTNLKGIYLNVRDPARALAIIEHILLIHPTAAPEIRDRGTLLARLGRTDEAIAQLEWYLGAMPEASDADRIRALVDDLRGTL